MLSAYKKKTKTNFLQFVLVFFVALLGCEKLRGSGEPLAATVCAHYCKNFKYFGAKGSLLRV